MIVRDRPTGLKLFLLMRGSVMPRISRVLIFNILLATAVSLSHGVLLHTKLTLTALPFSLIGLPLAIFLGFRNTAAYDRYWEARKLWGELVLRSRNLARECLTLIDEPPPGEEDLRPRMIRRAGAFCHALRLQLRGQGDLRDVQALLSSAEWAAMAGRRDLPQAIMMKQGEDLGACLRSGRINPNLAASVNTTLSAMTAAAASCERINNTPVPFSYTLLLHRTAYLYCFMLPFGLVDTLGLMTPAVVALVAYTFFGLDALGDELEEPFGAQANGLPLDAICRSIEIGLREALGEQDLPAELQAVDYCLM